MAAVARIFVRQFFAGHGRIDDAELVVSELFTNAVRYSRSKDEGNVIVGAIRQERSIRVEVTDQGSELLPQVRHATPNEDTGRGLFIVRTLANTWGHQTLTNSTTAWAVLNPSEPNTCPSALHPPPSVPLEDAFEGVVDLPPTLPFVLSGLRPSPSVPLEDAFEGLVDLPLTRPFALSGLRPGFRRPPHDPLERPLEEALEGQARSKFGRNGDRARPYVPPDRADWPAFCPPSRQEHRRGSLTPGQRPPLN
ncbi:ATP-binding protein [Acrocarpospora macrocephala]